MRTIVLLNKRKEQVTNSKSTPDLFLTFPQAGGMPVTIVWEDRKFGLLDQITHEEDEPGTELFHYLEV